MMVSPFVPKRERLIKSMMSLRRTSDLFKKYCEIPSRPIRRLTDTSLKSTGKNPEPLSKWSPACAMDILGLLGGPFQIKSSVLAPRRFLASRSPKSQRIESMTLLLPLPFGPTMAVIPAGNSKTVFWAKDLKPLSSRDFRNMRILLKFISRKHRKFYYKIQHPAPFLIRK